MSDPSQWWSRAQINIAEMIAQDRHLRDLADPLQADAEDVESFVALIRAAPKEDFFACQLFGFLMEREDWTEEDAARVANEMRKRFGTFILDAQMTILTGTMCIMTDALFKASLSSTTLFKAFSREGMGGDLRVADRALFNLFVLQMSSLPNFEYPEFTNFRPLVFPGDDSMDIDERFVLENAERWLGELYNAEPRVSAAELARYVFDDVRIRPWMHVEARSCFIKAGIATIDQFLLALEDNDVDERDLMYAFLQHAEKWTLMELRSPRVDEFIAGFRQRFGSFVYRDYYDDEERMTQGNIMNYVNGMIEFLSADPKVDAMILRAKYEVLYEKLSMIHDEDLPIGAWMRLMTMYHDKEVFLSFNNDDDVDMESADVAPRLFAPFEELNASIVHHPKFVARWTDAGRDVLDYYPGCLDEL